MARDTRYAQHQRLVHERAEPTPAAPNHTGPMSETSPSYRSTARPSPNAAGLLGISRWTAYNLASAGTLETIRLSENRLLVPVHSLLRLVGETRV